MSIALVLQFMHALAVAKNGRPRMDDGNLGEIVYWLYIKDNELDWKIEFIHFNENISINSRDTFTDRSTNYKVSDAGLGSPKDKRPYTELVTNSHLPLDLTRLFQW